MQGGTTTRWCKRGWRCGFHVWIHKALTCSILTSPLVFVAHKRQLRLGRSCTPILNDFVGRGLLKFFFACAGGFQHVQFCAFYHQSSHEFESSNIFKLSECWRRLRVRSEVLSGLWAKQRLSGMRPESAVWQNVRVLAIVIVCDKFNWFIYLHMTSIWPLLVPDVFEKSFDQTDRIGWRFLPWHGHKWT